MPAFDWEAFTPLGRIFRERQFARVQVSVERLDDEIYEAASSGNMNRARYLEGCRGQVPRWMAEADERTTRRAEA
jgi:hypothetical protein